MGGGFLPRDFARFPTMTEVSRSRHVDHQLNDTHSKDTVQLTASTIFDTIAVVNYYLLTR